MSSTKTSWWRYAVLIFLILGTLVWVLSLAPIPQDPNYHAFADTRRFAGIPNCFDVVSNLPFLFVGFLGLRFYIRHELGATGRAWIVLFAGVGLVSVGSAFYHWRPTNNSLVWDRLPMAVGFMSLFVALLGEYINSRLVSKFLIPAVALGISSVLYWYWAEDLRFYAWAQFMPLMTLPVILILFKSGYTHQWLLIIALVWYGAAKLSETYDLAIFERTQGFVSGHTIKHLLAAAGCYSILLMLRKREFRA